MDARQPSPAPLVFAGGLLAGAALVALLWALLGRAEPAPLVIYREASPAAAASDEYPPTSDSAPAASTRQIAASLVQPLPPRVSLLEPQVIPDPLAAPPESPPPAAVPLAEAPASSAAPADPEPRPAQDPQATPATGPGEDPQPLPARDPDPVPASPIVTTINVNTATAGELDTLPGIGPVLAQRIIESRQTSGPFRDVRDLQRVKGIGEKTAARLAPLVRFR